MSKEQNKSGRLINKATKTPRTQAAIKTYVDYIRSEDAVSIEFAQQLETELAEARTEVERLKRENVELLVKYDEKFDVIDAKDKLIEQMREALQYVYDIQSHQWASAFDIKVVKAALEAAERGR